LTTKSILLLINNKSKKNNSANNYQVFNHKAEANKIYFINILEDINNFKGQYINLDFTNDIKHFSTLLSCRKFFTNIKKTNFVDKHMLNLLLI